MLEKLAFNMMAIIFIIMMIGKFIKRKDKCYLYILLIQTIGIIINFIELLSGIKFSYGFKIFMYIFSIFIPIIIIIMELKWITLSDLVSRLIINYYLNTDNQEKAKKYCIELIEKNHSNLFAHKTLAEIYEKEGKIENALSEYLIVVDLNKDLNLEIKVAKLYSKVGKSENGIIMLENILNEKPDCLDASLVLGEILYEQESFKEAVSVYLNALQYNNMNYELCYNLGMVYIRLNDFSKAKEMYERAAVINHLDYMCKYNLGQIALIYNDIEEAEKYFLDTINNEEIEAESYYYLAEICLIKGEEDKAVQYANVAVELDSLIMKRIEKNPLFLFIVPKIIQIDKTNIKEKNMTNMEIKTQEHFEKTFELVGKFNNNDIRMAFNRKKIKNNKFIEKEIDEN